VARKCVMSAINGDVVERSAWLRQLGRGEGTRRREQVAFYAWKARARLAAYRGVSDSFAYKVGQLPRRERRALFSVPRASSE